MRQIMEPGGPDCGGGGGEREGDLVSSHFCKRWRVAFIWLTNPHP